MDIQTKKMWKAKAHALSPMVRIGKNGITPNQVEEVKKALKNKKLIKVKFLKAITKENERTIVRNMAEHLAKDTNAVLIDQIGFVAILYKR